MTDVSGAVSVNLEALLSKVAALQLPDDDEGGGAGDEAPQASAAPHHRPCPSKVASTRTPCETPPLAMTPNGRFILPDSARSRPPTSGEGDINTRPHDPFRGTVSASGPQGFFTTPSNPVVEAEDDLPSMLLARPLDFGAARTPPTVSKRPLYSPQPTTMHFSGDGGGMSGGSPLEAGRVETPELPHGNPRLRSPVWTNPRALYGVDPSAGGFMAMGPAHEQLGQGLHTPHGAIFASIAHLTGGGDVVAGQKKGRRKRGKGGGAGGGGGGAPHAPPSDVPPCGATAPSRLSGSTSATTLGRQAATATPVNVVPGQVVRVSRDQQGCRALQGILEQHYLHPPEGTGGGAEAEAERAQTVQLILAELLPALPLVMADAYGNFLVQKLLEVSPGPQRLSILRDYLCTSCSGGGNSPTGGGAGNVLANVACSPHGTFAVQKLIESLRSEEEEELVLTSLSQNLLLLMMDINGGHVVYKMLAYYQTLHGTLIARAAPVGEHGESAAETTTTADVNRQMMQKTYTFFHALFTHLLVICRHKQGCCVVQRCLDFFEPFDGYFVNLYDQLMQHLVTLAVDPYANYVITHVLELCRNTGRSMLVDVAAMAAQPSFAALCCDKFASNVVEQILRHASVAWVRTLTLQLLSPSTPSAPTAFPTYGGAPSQPRSISPSGEATLAMVARDQYGNYVVQRLLRAAPLDVLPVLLENVRALLPALGRTSVGKKLEGRVILAETRLHQSAGVS